MNAGELYKAGRLPEAIEAQVQEVKANPIDHAKRLFLFELLAFAGDLDRARRQIEAIKYDDTDLDMATLAYRKLLDAEQARRKLFAEGVPPGFFGEPSEHLRLRLEAVKRLREKRFGGGRREPGPGQRGHPAFPGSAQRAAVPVAPRRRRPVRGRPRGHGPRPVFLGRPRAGSAPDHESPAIPPRPALHPGPPRAGGGTGEVFLPALYPGSHEHADDQVKLGRMTDWKELDGGLALGVGLHTFLRDDDAISLLEWRESKRSDRNDTCRRGRRASESEVRRSRRTRRQSEPRSIDPGRVLKRHGQVESRKA